MGQSTKTRADDELDLLMLSLRVQGMSNSQVAKRLHVTKGTVDGAIYRAKRDDILYSGEPVVASWYR
jgi:transposase